MFQPQEKSACPHSCGHIMPAPALEKHVPICRLVAQGYSKTEAVSTLTLFNIMGLLLQSPIILLRNQATLKKHRQVLNLSKNFHSFLC